MCKLNNRNLPNKWSCDLNWVSTRSKQTITNFVYCCCFNTSIKTVKFASLNLLRLSNLAYAMQRLKKYLKNFLSWSAKMGEQFLDFVGVHNCYEGGHIAHGSPPPGKTLDVKSATESVLALFIVEKCQARPYKRQAPSLNFSPVRPVCTSQILKQN